MWVMVIITLVGDVLSLLGAGFVLWAIVVGGWRPSRECLVCAGFRRRGSVSAASRAELPTEAERRQVGGGG